MITILKSLNSYTNKYPFDFKKMINRIQLRLNPEDIHNESLIRKKIVESTKTDEPFEYRFIKRSIDARARNIKLQCTVDIYINEAIPLQTAKYKSLKNELQKNRYYYWSRSSRSICSTLRH